MLDLTRKIKTTLSDLFNNAARREVIDGQEVALFKGTFGGEMSLPYESFHQPPVVFEKASGMKGLSHQYFLPPDLLPRELQEYGMVSIRDRDGAYDRLTEVWEHLKKGNPETLGRLKFDETRAENLYHVILGAASAFPPADIQAWLEGWNGITLRKNKEAAFLLNKIEVCHGLVGWIPSMSTLNEMNRQSVRTQSVRIKSARIKKKRAPKAAKIKPANKNRKYIA